MQREDTNWSKFRANLDFRYGGEIQPSREAVRKGEEELTQRPPWLAGASSRQHLLVPVAGLQLNREQRAEQPNQQKGRVNE